jgi:hypothetical protein
MVIRKLISSFAAILASTLCAALVMMATSITPVMADSDGTGLDPTGRGDALMPWARGNAYKNHRDYAERVNVDAECGGCHAPILGVGYNSFAPGCLTCHGVKWDDDHRSNYARGTLSPGTELMNVVLFGDPDAWPNPQKNHRDYAERVDVSAKCGGCHSLTEGGKPFPDTNSAPGCFTCHGKKWDDRDGDRDRDGDSDGHRRDDDDSRSGYRSGWGGSGWGGYR